MFVLVCARTFAAPPANVGPQSAPVELGKYAKVHYVDVQRGDDLKGDGSREKPWASLPFALERAGSVPGGQRVALLLSQGRYEQPTFALKPRVDLFGGFAAPGGIRDVYRHATILEGGDVQRIALGADDARVDGVHFVRGRVRGKGAALFCDGASPTIANCIFTLNRTLGPQPWAPAQLHETANDGGAIFVANGAAPRIEHCLFFENTTECGRGAAIAIDRGAAARIVASVFANNRSGIDDRFRSSDGGAVSFFDGSGGELAGCIISANVALGRNDAGGVFVALWSSPRIADNVFVGNDGSDDAGALFIGGQEHRYGEELDAMPPADKFNVIVERNLIAGNTNSSKNSGAMRVTMESRATFRDNVIAENQGGFYLQRSEIVAERNTVWQEWRFVEDKPSLGESRLTGNILRGPIDGKIEARVKMPRNMMQRTYGGTEELPIEDVFEKDGLFGKIAAARFVAGEFVTVLALTEPIADAPSLAGRAIGVMYGRNFQWRAIKRASSREIVVWGRFEAETQQPEAFTVLRTFKLTSKAPPGVGARVGESKP
jgi:hypothetical protein